MRTQAARQALALRSAAPQGATPAQGGLPEWDLADLYPGMESPEYAQDIALALSDCKAFADLYRGKLANLATGPGASRALFDMLARYERLEDLIGRIMSYAGLIYAGDTTDPQRAKFFGDAQEKITNASTDLVFLTLELNRIDDALLEAAMNEAPLAHYRPWIEDVRREKPYQLEDRVEQLFHEKSFKGREKFSGKLVAKH